MTSHYEYPDWLYCVGCGIDVEPKIEKMDGKIEHESGRKVSFEYNVAVCPNCGNILCKRDYDFMFVRAIDRFKEEGAK